MEVEDHKAGGAEKQLTDPPMDYSKEDHPILTKSGEGADLQIRKYKVVDELHRGRFSTVGRCVRADDHRIFAAKVLITENRKEEVKLELDMLRSLRHQRLGLLHEAYQLGECVVLIQELLSGSDILEYLSQRNEYSEQIVAVLITQMLDGLGYLQWKGICHLDLQPSNLVLTSTRFPSLKIVDFGSARKVEAAGTDVPVNGLTDYIAPEVLFDGKAYPNSDIWSLGVIIYVLLAGVSPFTGDTEEDLMANIQCVRYRFEWLPVTTTQEANRFLMLIFKRDPSKRPTVTECLEHRWLNETEFMVKKRERAPIISNKIRDYSQHYHKEQRRVVTNNKLLLSYAGLKQ
uniref:Muscle M-line assembly protein unc-89-like isoform X8 n=2 Tax=Hirondellea gigas TaxID=1518452 RepID=A0A6A7FT23_9CRUS